MSCIDGKKPKPIWVREYKDGYQVLDGHHRLGTDQKLRLPTIENLYCSTRVNKNPKRVD